MTAAHATTPKTAPIAASAFVRAGHAVLAIVLLALFGAIADTARAQADGPVATTASQVAAAPALAPADGTCCSDDGECACGEPSDESCCCSELESRGEAACSAACDCGSDTPTLDAPPTLELPLCALPPRRQAHRLPAPPPSLSDFLSRPFAAPALRVDPPPPKGGRMASNG